MNALQLKNSILQMAVQGKLVPQDPNDEPANVLLERIRKEKEKLIKEGKIKKEKNPSYIFRGEDNLPYEKVGKNEPICIADEVPFEIPDSWEWVRLCNIGENSDNAFADGPFGSNLKKEHYTNEQQVRLIQLSNIGEEGWRNENTKYTTYDHALTLGRSMVKAGSIVIAKMMPAGRAIIVPDIEKDYILSSDAVKFIPHSSLNVEYLLCAINSPAFRNQVVAESHGVTRIRTSLGKLKTYLLPIPPLNEQKRIVDRINQVTEYLKSFENIEVKRLKLDVDFPALLKKSILQQAVMGKLVPQNPNDEPASALLEKIRAEKDALIKAGKLKKDKHESIIYRRENSYYEMVNGIEYCIDDEIPFEIPDSWEWVRLTDFAYLTSGSQYVESDFGCLYVKVSDMNLPGNEDEITTSAHFTIEKVQGDIPENSIIFPKRGGAIATNKRRKVINERICIDSNTMALTAIYGECYDYLYLWFLTVDLGKLQTGTSVPQINNKDLEPRFIPVPSLNEQERIVARVETLSHFVDYLQNWRK